MSGSPLGPAHSPGGWSCAITTAATLGMPKHVSKAAVMSPGPGFAKQPHSAIGVALLRLFFAQLGSEASTPHTLSALLL